ncbi:MAG: UDP-N-acetylglucosamine 2-epimerase (non-hydrolyzing) [Deltaproteobacteria bacterium]|nr:UDP-N-acetylglucosamine 2-epimerase (non-hydrolyzing) [Deltaproteobacteria bacterium]
MRLCITLGTRPEIIKMSPIIRECEKRGLDHFILHTGQHYSYNMDKVFFEQLCLPEPKYNLDVGSGSHAEETGKMLIGIEKILSEEKPDLVLVEGDTNTVLAGSLAASKLHIKVGHVEAGLRSGDRSMPEEINRTLTDHISDYLFAPTEKAMEILLKEGISEDKIFVTGNTIVDAIYHSLNLLNPNSNNVERRTLSIERSVLNLERRTLNLERKRYFLLTLHRQENVDNKDRLNSIFEGLKLVCSEYHLPILYPIHPRTKRRIGEFKLRIPDGIKLTDPLDYLEFLQLEKNAEAVFTDSGGVQEEACILGIPCITLRDNTERPETLEVGANILSGNDPDKILESAKLMINKENNWQNPFGDGTAGKRIIEILCHLLA